MTVLAQPQVRMLTAIAGEYVAQEGDVLELPAGLAQRWVAAGIAEWWSPPETGMEGGAPERAVRRPGRGRG